MPSYAVLPARSANRVYAGSTLALARAELSVVARFGLPGRLADITDQELGGVRYLILRTADDRALDDDELALIGALSFTYAVFALDGDTDQPVLRPRRAGGSLDHWDDDLLSIPRYPGRTNEQFTRLLVNLALVAGHGRPGLTGRHLRVLDPVCGRGTTVNQAVMYGLDGAGDELDARLVEAWATFLSTWLQDKRIKHRVERHRLRRGRTNGALWVEVALWADKERQKADEGQKLVVVADDTRNAVEHLGRRSVDAIAGDLPYGVQHGSRTDDRLSRTPGDLLSAALPVWREVLRPGGVMALAWNVRTLSPEAVDDALTSAGLEPIPPGPGVSFLHRVDRSITRDVLLARRPPEAG